MIKFTAKFKDGKTLIVLGLSDKNVEKLTTEQPIVVDGTDIDQPGINIMIFHGKTEKAMYEMLKDAGFNIKQAVIDLKSMKEPK